MYVRYVHVLATSKSGPSSCPLGARPFHERLGMVRMATLRDPSTFSASLAILHFQSQKRCRINNCPVRHFDNIARHLKWLYINLCHSETAREPPDGGPRGSVDSWLTTLGSVTMKPPA
jgi:hypothetical protein